MAPLATCKRAANSVSHGTPGPNSTTRKRAIAARANFLHRRHAEHHRLGSAADRGHSGIGYVRNRLAPRRIRGQRVCLHEPSGRQNWLKSNFQRRGLWDRQEGLRPRTSLHLSASPGSPDFRRGRSGGGFGLSPLGARSRRASCESGTAVAFQSSHQGRKAVANSATIEVNFRMN